MSASKRAPKLKSAPKMESEAEARARCDAEKVALSATSEPWALRGKLETLVAMGREVDASCPGSELQDGLPRFAAATLKAISLALAHEDAGDEIPSCSVQFGVCDAVTALAGLATLLEIVPELNARMKESDGGKG